MPLSFTELRRAYKAKYPDPAPVWQDIDGTPFVPEFVEDPTHISGYKLTDPRELTLQQRELNDVWWESKFKHLRQQTNNGVINGAEPIFIDASLKHYRCFFKFGKGGFSPSHTIKEYEETDQE
jgi:hypothetical protein